MSVYDLSYNDGIEAGMKQAEPELKALRERISALLALMAGLEGENQRWKEWHSRSIDEFRELKLLRAALKAKDEVLVQVEGAGKNLAAQLSRSEEALRKAGAERDEEVGRLRAALVEIAEGRGRFSRNPLLHAENTIEDMKNAANGALHQP